MTITSYGGVRRVRPADTEEAEVTDKQLRGIVHAIIAISEEVDRLQRVNRDMMLSLQGGPFTYDHVDFTEGSVRAIFDEHDLSPDDINA